jgi:hypothetical protein
MAPEDMTSKEYYLDSTAHFAVHEVWREKKGFISRKLSFSFRNY